jgi:predicted RecA/RadA family phage recombinase
MAKNHLQPGVVIDVVLTAAATSGDLIAVGTFVGIALKSGAIGDTISVQIEEVFTVPKLGTDVMSQGVVVYLDATNKRVTLDDAEGANIKAGKTVTAAGNGVTAVALKLNA